MKIFNPATDEVITTLESDTKASVQQKWSQARNFEREWQQTPLAEKKQALKTYMTLVEKNSEVMSRDLSLETGKPQHQALGEIQANQNRIKFFIDNVDAVMEKQIAYTEKGLSEEITFDALGTIANISAWNFPYFVSTNVVMPALLTGNCVLFKPSEFASLSGQHMIRLLHEAGIPKQALHLVLGDGAIGAELLSLDIDGIYFTGSYPTGRKIAQSVATKLCRLQLELGGKDPAYIAEDMKPEVVAPMVGDGCFYNAGQSCCAVERLYVHESIYDAFLSELVKFAKSLKVGDPLSRETYLGPLTRKAQVEVIMNQIKDATSKGAKLLTGGKAVGHNGGWLEPTVLSHVDHSMEIMREESFGPIIGVQSVGSDEKAIEHMNNTRYGLTSSIYTDSEERARKVLNAMRSGSVYWNCCDRVSPHLPWSGRGHSGVGSTLSKIGIQSFLQPKAWHLKN